MANPTTFDISSVREESRLIGEAAKQVLRKGTVGVGESVRRAGIGFKEGTTSNKLAVLGGISSGMTFALEGLRTLRNGLHKDENTGRRDYASAALGVAELAGGTFLTALFWERLKMNVPEEQKSASRY